MKQKLKLVEVEHEKNGYHYFLKLKINGLKASFLVDTGATHSVMDIERFKSFSTDEKPKENESLSTGLGTNSMQSHYVKLKSLEIGDLKLKKFHMVLMDLSHVNQSYASMGKDPIDGVLGTNVLRKLQAVINLNKKGAFMEIKG